MPRIVTNTEQKRYIDPFQQRIHNWEGSNDPKHYLSRTINSLLKSIGNDIILDGLNVTTSFTENKITATISPGLLIQDNTILELESEVVLELENANSYSPDGNFIISCSYQYIQTPNPNPFRFEMNYISPSGSPAFTPYLVEKHRTLIDILDFETDPITDDIIDVYQSYRESVTIFGNTFYRNGHCKENVKSKKLRKYFIDHIKIVDYDYTAECGDVICVDTSESVINITLPENPIRGDYVTIMDFKSTFGLNQVNILRNGSLIKGQEINISIGESDEWARFRFTGLRRGWLVESPGAGDIQYTLPPATDTTLGGVIVGSGILVDGSGTISVETLSEENYTTLEKNKLAGIEENANNYVLPHASAATLGGIKVGSGLSINIDGVLNLAANIGDLTDVQSTMGTAGQILMVNDAEDGLEYRDIPPVDDLDCGTFT